MQHGARGPAPAVPGDDEEEHDGAGTVVGGERGHRHPAHLHGHVGGQGAHDPGAQAHVADEQAGGDGGAVDGPRVEALGQARGVVAMEVGEEEVARAGAQETEAVHVQAGAGDVLERLHLAGHAAVELLAGRAGELQSGGIEGEAAPARAGSRGNQAW